MLTPASTEEPAEDWYKAMFPKAAYVYEDHGHLWLTLRALLQSGTIETPGEIGDQGSVRSLVEAVYGAAAHAVPQRLWSASQKAAGKRRAERSIAGFNELKLDQGYCIAAGDWDAETRTPTRLGDEGRPVYLAREQDGDLVPLLDSPRYPWEHSSIRIDVVKIDGLAPAWQARFAAAIARLQATVPLLAVDSGGLILPLIADGNGWSGECQTKGKTQPVKYNRQLGLVL